MDEVSALENSKWNEMLPFLMPLLKKLRQTPVSDSKV